MQDFVLQTPETNSVPITAILYTLPKNSKGIYRVKFKVQKPVQNLLVGVTNKKIKDFKVKKDGSKIYKGLDELDGCWCLNLFDGQTTHDNVSNEYMSKYDTFKMVEIEINKTLGTL